MGIKIFVINLSSNHKRWQSIQQQLQDANVTNFERFPAVWGKMLETSPDRELVDDYILEKAKKSAREFHWDHNLGSLGCYLSHVKIWKVIEKENDDLFIVCEDDVAIPRDFLDRLNFVLENAPPHWGYLNIGITGQIIRNIKHPTFKSNDIIWEERPATCTGCYVITKKMATNFLRHAFPVRKQVDWWISDMRSIFKKQIWIIKQPIVKLTQFSRESDINHSPVKRLNASPTISQTNVTIILVCTIVPVVLIAFVVTIILLKYSKSNKIKIN